jgi:hypothetical protein
MTTGVPPRNKYFNYFKEKWILLRRNQLASEKTIMPILSPNTLATAIREDCARLASFPNRHSQFVTFHYGNFIKKVCATGQLFSFPGV